MRKMGGLWSTVPRMGGVALFFAMASLGLPGLGNFVAEFLILLGSFQVDPVLTIMATLGLVLAAVYAFRFIQDTFHGPNRQGWKVPDLAPRDLAIMAVMIIALVYLGLYPQPILDTASPALSHLQRMVEHPSILGR
jgi:NADH-quinone oxidoreductase subunit M